MTKLIIQLLLILILCGAFSAFAGDQVIIQSAAKVDFTPNAKLDIYEAIVKGTTLDDYIITYRILAYNGTELYSFSAKYASVGIDPSEGKEDIQQDLKRQTKTAGQQENI